MGSSTRKDLILITAGLLIGAGLGLLIFLGFFGRDSSAGAAEPLAGRAVPASLVEGSPAPDFQLEDLSGQQVRLSDFQGKTVLINFWATWCGPCRLEMPAIQARFEGHAGDLAVLAVNFDEPAAVVRQYAEELQLTFTILLDPGGEIQRLYRVRGYPTTYFIDQDGKVRIQHIGLMTETQMDAYLSQLGVAE